MKTTHDLAQLSWTLSGLAPYLWEITKINGQINPNAAEIGPLPAKVPGSVQAALREAGMIPDWNVGLNYRLCQWVENLHWIYHADLPDSWFTPGEQFRLDCQGLDDRGWIFLNQHEVGRFKGAHLPYHFDLTPYLKTSGNSLYLVFDLPPRWLGQFGFTSQMTEWKPRFYYTWDWTVRLVQIGVWDSICLVAGDGNELEGVRCTTGVDPQTRRGSIRLSCQVKGGEAASVRVQLSGADGLVGELRLPVEIAKEGLTWENLPVDLWQPNGLGAQPLYTLTCQLLSASGRLLDETRRQIGFRWVEWRACTPSGALTSAEGSPAAADPWICAVNGQPLFLQGANWTPIRPNFADLTEADYRTRLELYRDLGFNLLRVWGGAFLETETFYRLCDELGLLVWQEFPLSSSGADNWPPEDEASIAALAEIAASYIHRRQHHASLLLWCGGNELVGGPDGSKVGAFQPVDASHPMIKRLGEVTAALDPGRRFLPTSSSGPRFSARREDFGKGLHWDVHGPWTADPDLAVWKDYWEQVDALFHSEVGAPGASSAELIRRYKGDLQETPGSSANPLWRRTSWWIEWPLFVKEHGREPASLEEYVAWSQDRQAKALAIVARALKDKFPRCGGVIFWMGHDCFPCTANTSLIDFEGAPKPAALAVGKIFKSTD